MLVGVYNIVISGTEIRIRSRSVTTERMFEMKVRLARVLAVLALTTTLGACTPTDQPTPSTTPTPSPTVTCATEDQDGWCVWEGTYRYWDSRSIAEQNQADWEMDTASDE
jgi:hypothetical protein